jgi:predicted transcriptional regulator
MERDDDLQKRLDRMARLAELDSAIMHGVADAEAGRTIDSDELFDDLIRQIRKASCSTP